MPKINVVMLGDSGVGKTTFLQYVTEGKISNKPSNGSDFISFYHIYKHNPIAYHIGDLAGEMRFFAMNKDILFKMVYQAAILMVDLTDRVSFENAEIWLNLLREHSPNCHVYLVGNKHDLDKKVVTEDELKQFALKQNLQPPILTVASKGVNTLQILNDIAEKNATEALSFHYDAEIGVFGFEKTGKSSLCKKLQNENNPDGENEFEKYSTETIWRNQAFKHQFHVYPSHFKHKSQEIRHLNAAIVCLDLTAKDGLKAAKTYLKKIRQTGFFKPIILVGTKVDATENLAITQEQLAKFINENKISHFVLTSAHANQYIKELKDEISSVIAETKVGNKPTDEYQADIIKSLNSYYQNRKSEFEKNGKQHRWNFLGFIGLGVSFFEKERAYLKLMRKLQGERVHLDKKNIDAIKNGKFFKTVIKPHQEKIENLFDIKISNRV